MPIIKSITKAEPFKLPRMHWYVCAS